MDWKEFIKPKWYKILMTLFFLGLISFVFGFFDTCFCGMCPPGQSVYHAPFSCQCNCIIQSQTTNLNLLQRGPIYLLEIILSYIFSCIVFIRKSLN